MYLLRETLSDHLGSYFHVLFSDHLKQTPSQQNRRLRLGRLATWHSLSSGQSQQLNSLFFADVESTHLLHPAFPRQPTSTRGYLTILRQCYSNPLYWFFKFYCYSLSGCVLQPQSQYRPCVSPTYPGTQQSHLVLQFSWLLTNIDHILNYRLVFQYCFSPYPNCPPIQPATWDAVALK